MMKSFQSIALLLILVVSSAAAFQGSKVQSLPQTRSSKNSSSKLMFHFDDFDATNMETIDLEAIEKSVESLLLSTTTNLASAAENPELESEVLMDVSHLFLDFSVFVTQNKPVLDVAQVIGRILILAQDYIPDRHIQPEELGIQVVMIATCIAKRGRKPHNNMHEN